VEGFSIKIDYYSQDNSIVIVKLSGYVDQSNSHQIEKVISDLLQSNKQKFIFDLNQLIYMSSAGWGIFVGEIKTVRDAGGDIKVASMSPEVYDVFQVLEFYHILEDYSTVEDAIGSFTENGTGGVEDLVGAEITLKEDQEDSHAEDVLTEDIVPLPDDSTPEIDAPLPEETAPEITPSFKPVEVESNFDISNLPLGEKLKKIIAIYPLLSVRQIQKMLHHEKFGYTKINLLKLYYILRDLNLHTKKARYRFYRST
jgi:anti-sigma B factor antagonist